MFMNKLKVLWRHSTIIILSPTARRQSTAASVQKLPDSVVKLVSTARDVSGETIRLAFSLSLAFDFLHILNVKDFFFFVGAAAQFRCVWLPRSRGFSWSHKTDSKQSVGLLWTSDRLVAETSTWQYTTLTTDRHPCPQWDSNLRSQQASGRRPTP